MLMQSGSSCDNKNMLIEQMFRCFEHFDDDDDDDNDDDDDDYDVQVQQPQPQVL